MASTLVINEIHDDFTKKQLRYFYSIFGPVQSVYIESAGRIGYRTAYIEFHNENKCRKIIAAGPKISRGHILYPPQRDWNPPPLLPNATIRPECRINVKGICFRSPTEGKRLKNYFAWYFEKCGAVERIDLCNQYATIQFKNSVSVDRCLHQNNQTWNNGDVFQVERVEETRNDNRQMREQREKDVPTPQLWPGTSKKAAHNSKKNAVITSPPPLIPCPSQGSSNSQGDARAKTPTLVLKGLKWRSENPIPNSDIAEKLGTSNASNALHAASEGQLNGKMRLKPHKMNFYQAREAKFSICKHIDERSRKIYCSHRTRIVTVAGGVKRKEKRLFCTDSCYTIHTQTREGLSMDEIARIKNTGPYSISIDEISCKLAAEAKKGLPLSLRILKIDRFMIDKVYNVVSNHNDRDITDVNKIKALLTMPSCPFKITLPQLRIVLGILQYEHGLENDTKIDDSEENGLRELAKLEDIHKNEARMINGVRPNQNYLRYLPRVNWPTSMFTFYGRFKLRRKDAEDLLTKIECCLWPERNYRHALTPAQKLLVTLDFYVTNDTYEQLKKRHQISPSSVRDALLEVTRAIISHIPRKNRCPKASSSDRFMCLKGKYLRRGANRKNSILRVNRQDAKIIVDACDRLTRLYPKVQKTI
ncbi:hypothetical protein Ddc_13018 [Ditylenchus destructor]|nr:hypothetical protein Ddc_13018 [Ditylenchus destructor]